MFLRSTNRKKDGKDHRYFSIVENQRVSGNKTVQRTVLYLGEIHDQQQASWRKTLSVFDEDKQEYRELSLFPEDRPLPQDAVDSIQVRLSGLDLRRPRPFGDCGLASELWRQLGLSEFWRDRLPEGREAVSWEKVLRLLVVNRLLEPGSEFRVHRQWFVESAMDALLESDFQVAGKDRLYRCLDPVLEHKQELFVYNGSSDRGWRKHHRRSGHAGGEEDSWEDPTKGGDRQHQGNKLNERKKIMNSPNIVTQDEWLAARRERLAREKEFDHERDRLTEARRKLLMVKVEKEYVFDGPKGTRPSVSFSKDDDNCSCITSCLTRITTQAASTALV